MSDEKVSLPLCGGPHCGGKGVAESLHHCPYASEINDDHEEKCTCCDECTHECAMDI
jgi:hypothetical protein